jgi:hypothetical protein
MFSQSLIYYFLTFSSCFFFLTTDFIPLMTISMKVNEIYKSFHILSLTPLNNKVDKWIWRCCHTERATETNLHEVLHLTIGCFLLSIYFNFSYYWYYTIRSKLYCLEIVSQIMYRHLLLNVLKAVLFWMSKFLTAKAGFLSHHNYALVFREKGFFGKK